tara:strand:- start:37 stop:1137 length:1101 start_codon:yes stop_codon:yes gene_type:complete
MSKAAELAALIGSQTALSNRNFVINGAMQISQRSASVTGIGTTDTSGTYHTLDRFAVLANNTAGRLTMSQSTVTDLPGFANALKLDCTTADTSIAADEYFIFVTRLEAQNLQSLKKGTSSAEPVTVSFYVKGNANATYVLEIFDNDNSRTINKTFSVTSSWNRVSITYPGDTAGSGLGDDNEIGLQLVFWLHAGSNTTSGSLQTSWGAYDQTKRAAGISSIVDSTDRTLEITGLQMEIGEVATAFEHEDIGTTLAKCQRYYQRIDARTTYDGLIDGTFYATTQFFGLHNFPVQMRSNPSMTGSGTFSVMSNGADRTPDSLIVQRSNVHLMQTYSGLSGGNVGTAGHAGQIRANNDADTFLEFIAEL